MNALNPASTLATAGPIFAATAAIQVRLAAVFPSSRFQHGMLPAVPTRESWQTLVRRTPFVGVTWLGANPSPSSGRLLRLVSTWRVLLVTSNTAVAGRFLGDAGGPGQFGLVQVAAAALHGLTPPAADEIADFGTLMVTETTALSADWSEAAEAIAGLTVASEFDLLDSADALPALLRLRGGWQFDAGDATAAIADQNLTGAP